MFYTVNGLNPEVAVCMNFGVGVVLKMTADDGHD